MGGNGNWISVASQGILALPAGHQKPYLACCVSLGKE